MAMSDGSPSGISGTGGSSMRPTDNGRTSGRSGGVGRALGSAMVRPLFVVTSNLFSGGGPGPLSRWRSDVFDCFGFCLYRIATPANTQNGAHEEET